jgi:hypothetical protein
MCARRPPSEAALRQHIVCASLQTKVWHPSCLAKSHLPSPLEYGWRTFKDSLHPVYFEGNMSAEFLRDPLLQGYMNGRFYMILILGKNICQYMQGSALHKHRTFRIAVPVTQNALYIFFALFVADLYSVDAFCCIQEVRFWLLTHI